MPAGLAASKLTRPGVYTDEAPGDLDRIEEGGEAIFCGAVLGWYGSCIDGEEDIVFP